MEMYVHSSVRSAARYVALSIVYAALFTATALLSGCDWLPIHPPGDDDGPPVVRTIATGLVSPLGLEIDRADRLWIAEAGTGEAHTSQISVASPDGDVAPFMTGLPSTIVQGSPSGANHVFKRGARVYIALGEVPGAEVQQVVLAADASSFEPGDEPLTFHDAEVVAEVGAYALDQGAETSNPYRMARGGSALLVTDAGANALFRIHPASGNVETVTVFDDLPNPTDPLVGPPAVNAVPTGLASGQNGAWVGALTGFPFVDGLARVYRVESDGSTSVYADDLTALVDITQDARGDVYVLQHGTFDLSAGGWQAETGQVLKLTEDGSEPIVTGLDRPTGLRFDRLGRLYIVTLGGDLIQVTFPGRAAR